MYIIENANVLKDKQLTTCSLLIRNDQITVLHNGTAHYKYMKMNLAPYIMTPAYVLFSSAIPFESSFQVLKAFFTENFILKGCTTIFTYVSLSYENELLDKLNDVKKALMSSPIDFLIGIKIPARLMTPTLIRKCKKLKIPAIFLEIQDSLELEKIPWGWIREAMFPFNSPLIPIISSEQKKEAETLLSKWKDRVIKEKIPALYHLIEEGQPLSIPILNKIGLYPNKGCFMTGTELSYNLYLKDREIAKVDEESLFHYHSNRLVVTVDKGKVIRSGEKVLFSPGSGEFVQVRTPFFFSL